MEGPPLLDLAIRNAVEGALKGALIHFGTKVRERKPRLSVIKSIELNKSIKTQRFNFYRMGAVTTSLIELHSVEKKLNSTVNGIG